jgi:insertion element IS1 protein InsB
MKMNCIKCSKSLIRRGFQANGAQRYFCKACKRYCQAAYKYNAYKPDMNMQIIKWLKVGGTLRQTAKALGIAFNTFQKRTTLLIADGLKNPIPDKAGDTYEIDKLKTHIGSPKKECWLLSALNRRTGMVSGMSLGSRKKEDFKGVINYILRASPKRIYTDGLANYASLIPETIHKIAKKMLYKIERFHLSLRTHIASLRRDEICRAKSIIHLLARVKIYCWS